MIGDELNGGAEHRDAGEGVSRRRLLKGGLGIAGAAAAAPLLAACGSSSKSSSSASSSGAATSVSTGTSAPSASSAYGASLQKLLGLPTGKAAGQGLTINVGFDSSLSGPSAAFGVEQYHGVLAGVTAMKAAGGPTFKVTALSTTDTATGAANTRQFGSSGITLVITSQVGALTAGLPLYPKYEMIAMCGNGSETAFGGYPNYYQGSPPRNTAYIPIIVNYLKAKLPSVKTIAYIEEDFGAISDATTAQTKSILEAAGFTFHLVLIPAMTTDFTEAIQMAGRLNPDLVISDTVGGTDMGLLMKQYVALGFKAPVVGLDYTPGAAKFAGPAFADNFYFSAPYFAPHNQWGTLFATNFQKQFGYAANYYNANYYQVVFWYWELIRRVIASGGDPTKSSNGAAFITALNSNPTFPSVYGNSGTVGSSTFDAKTHTLSHGLMSFGKGGANNNPTILATADLTGADFKLTAAA